MYKLFVSVKQIYVKQHFASIELIVLQIQIDIKAYFGCELHVSTNKGFTSYRNKRYSLNVVNVL